MGNMTSGHGYADAPELAPQQFPEVVHQTHPQPGYGEQYTQVNNQTPKPEVYSPFTENAIPAGTYSHPGSPSQQPEPEEKRSRKGGICGVSTLVFLLSCIIGLLAAAVVGLAAGTGVEAHRASVAESRLANLSAVMATATPTPTVSSNGTTTAGQAAAATTAWNELDKGCSNDPERVTGTTYSSFKCRFPFHHPTSSPS
ncbi:hypothetical protein DL546_008434 [Coniochaeta pulveracea]|uniref:Uncharacterized protein n=1 Tax=Coniochaeta pulveracea TaxID=177199 RepID=A0A420YDA9_9PEZI|nr:hypothetical protein DL546_008434 [Coniochaeta pulveracea]